MGEIKIRWVHLAKVSTTLRRLTKGKKKIHVRFVLASQGNTSPRLTATVGHSGFTLRVPEVAGAVTTGVVVTDPASAALGEISLSPVRFSSTVRVEVTEGDGTNAGAAKVVAFGEISLQHSVHGVPRRVRMHLFPPPQIVSDDVPSCSVICEVAVDILPVDFGDDPAQVDHVRRVEEEQPLVERLRLILTATNPARLPYLDEEVLAARGKGWAATLSALVEKIPGRKEPTVATLRVKIKQAFECPREGSSFIDAYVVLSAAAPAGAFNFGESFQTTAAKSQENPVFDETFQLSLLHGSAETLRLCLWDYDSTSADDWVGEARLPLGFLVRGVATVRKLPVFATTSASDPISWIAVELLAVDFGLDAALADLVSHAVSVEAPRLVRYFTCRPSVKGGLRTVEDLLIKHVLPPDGDGIDAYVRKTLVPVHGLEPLRDTVSVTIHSIQDLVAPSNRSRIDLSAAVAAKPQERLSIWVNGFLLSQTGDGPAYFVATQSACPVVPRPSKAKHSASQNHTMHACTSLSVGQDHTFLREIGRSPENVMLCWPRSSSA